MKTAVIYARYSSERQTEQSIEGQLTVCNKFAQDNDILIVKQYIDRAMTGTNDNRMEFQQMLKDSEHENWDIVLVYAIDRFGRNSIEVALNKQRLKKTGKTLISATQRTSENVDGSKNLDGILLENVYIGIAEYYSAELSQKVRRGLNESRKKGNFTGGFMLYGYSVVGTRKEGRKVVINEDEAAIVRYIFEQFASGRRLKDVDLELREKGVQYKGKPFSRTRIYAMVNNEKYIGIYRYGDEVYTNIYPPIVPKTLFETAKLKLERNRYGCHSTDTVYLLKHKVICGKCNHIISSSAGTSGSGEVRRYYKCTNFGKDKCNVKPIRKEQLERLVVDATIEAFANDELIDQIADRILQANQVRINDTSMLNLLNKQMEELDKGIENLVNAVQQGIVTKSTQTRIMQLEQQKDDLEMKIAAERARGELSIKKSDILRYLKATIKKEPLAMVTLLIKSVTIDNETIKILYNYTDDKRPDDEHQAFLFYKKDCDLHKDRTGFGSTDTTEQYNLECWI